MAETTKFICRQGETFERLLRFKNRTTGTPKDISGWVFHMDIRIDANADVVATATITPRTPTTDGEADCIIAHTITDDLAPRTYRFDIRADYSGKRKFYVEGEFVVEPAITRS